MSVSAVLFLVVIGGSWGTLVPSTPSLAVAASPVICPAACFCNAPSKIVYCSRRGLGRVPSGIPPDSLQLNLNGNAFLSPTLESSNFTGLERLEHLYVSECGVEKIYVGTFQLLINLKWLDLSNNRIKSVPPYGFNGLRLQHLFLNGNRHIHLVPDSFEGLVTTGLYLHDCSLTRLYSDVLAPLNGSLKYLWLNGNELDKVDSRLDNLFTSLSHLRLGSNPLHCNCEAMWLKEFYDKNGEIFKGAVLPSCLTPTRLKSRHFNELTLLDFRCQAPMFNNIETTFGLSTGRLKCAASGDPAPTLYWIQPSGKTTRYEPPIEEEARTSEGVLSLTLVGTGEDVEDLDGSPSTLFGMYICVANNEVGNVTLTINVSWPLLSPSPLELSQITGATISSSRSPHTQSIQYGIIPSVTSSSTSHDVPMYSSNSSPAPLGSPNQHPHHRPGFEPPSGNYTVVHTEVGAERIDGEDEEGVHRRQRLFTVTEFVCAILGTHVATLLLCILVIPLVYRTRWRRRLLEKQQQQEQQQLHHRLHYDPQLTSQRLQQQTSSTACGRTVSREKQPLPALPERQRSLSDEQWSYGDESTAYLNGTNSYHRPHQQELTHCLPHPQTFRPPPPPLYLTDYLLTK